MSFLLGMLMTKRLVAITALLLVIALSASAENTRPNTFAQCLADTGALMYSAWWCPSCFGQLRAMDPSLTREGMKNEEKLTREFPFVRECAEPETGKFAGKCPRDLVGIPTWEFADGSRLLGIQDLAALSRKTGCALGVTENPR